MDNFNSQNIPEGFTPNEEYGKPQEQYPDSSEINRVNSNIQNKNHSNFPQAPVPEYLPISSSEYPQPQISYQQQFSQPNGFSQPSQQSQPNMPSYISPPIYQPPYIQNNPQNQYNPTTQLSNGNIYIPPPEYNIPISQEIVQQPIVYPNQEVLNIKASQKRLRCQIILIIFLFTIVISSIIFQILGYLEYFVITDDIFIIINIIWMIYYTTKGEISRRKEIGIFSLISCLMSCSLRFSGISDIYDDRDYDYDRDYDNDSNKEGLFLLYAYYVITIKIIVTSYNMICSCCCCDCNKCDN